VSSHDLCPACGHPDRDHLTADECAAHGIDPGLRDGLGCAVVTRSISPFAVPVRRPGSCSHPAIPDRMLVADADEVAGVWCPSCRDWLYAHDEQDEIVVYVGEPWNAAGDPRPDPSHRDYWSE
jgi:hypothetical protein